MLEMFFLIKLFGIFEEFFTLSPLYTVGWFSKTYMFDLKLLAENDTKEKIKNLIQTKIVRIIFFLSWFASDQGFLYARVLKLLIWIFGIHIGDCLN